MAVTYNAGFVELNDGEEIYLGFVEAVTNIIGSNGGQQYEVFLSGGHHVTIKESDYARATFITKWKNALDTINGAIV